jgi:APA family basic amino acid/polyamine antiporter
MTVAGPRVLQVIGQDISALRALARTNRDGVPATAILVQSSLAILFILTSSFESVLVFAGFILALNSFATVLGVFVLRWRQPELARPYRTFAYPLTPLIYLAVTGWTLIFVLLDKPTESLLGLGVIAIGLAVYTLVPRPESVSAP